MTLEEPESLLPDVEQRRPMTMFQSSCCGQQIAFVSVAVILRERDPDVLGELVAF